MKLNYVQGKEEEEQSSCPPGDSSNQLPSGIRASSLTPPLNYFSASMSDSMSGIVGVFVPGSLGVETVPMFQTTRLSDGANLTSGRIMASTTSDEA